VTDWLDIRRAVEAGFNSNQYVYFIRTDGSPYAALVDTCLAYVTYHRENPPVPTQGSAIKNTLMRLKYVEPYMFAATEQDRGSNGVDLFLSARARVGAKLWKAEVQALNEQRRVLHPNDPFSPVKWVPPPAPRTVAGVSLAEEYLNSVEVDWVGWLVRSVLPLWDKWTDHDRLSLATRLECRIDYETCVELAGKANHAQGIWPILIVDLLTPASDGRQPLSSRRGFAQLAREHPGCNLGTFVDDDIFAHATSIMGTAGKVVVKIGEAILIDKAGKALGDLYDQLHDAKERYRAEQERKRQAEAEVMAATLAAAKEVLEHDREMRERIERAKPMDGAERAIDGFERNFDTLSSTG
jgi:hypothetical protein